MQTTLAISCKWVAHACYTTWILWTQWCRTACCSSVPCIIHAVKLHWPDIYPCVMLAKSCCLISNILLLHKKRANLWITSNHSIRHDRSLMSAVTWRGGALVLGVLDGIRRRSDNIITVMVLCREITYLLESTPRRREDDAVGNNSNWKATAMNNVWKVLPFEAMISICLSSLILTSTEWLQSARCGCLELSWTRSRDR